VKLLTEAFKKQIVQRIVRNLLDIQVLRLLQTEPTWGYEIKKKTEAEFDVKLRHGLLYPLLNKLEEEGFITSQRQRKGGRIRRVCSITTKGEEYLEAYKSVLEEQVHK
jgi:DNA-binding PadR family transcriptional regulator